LVGAGASIVSNGQACSLLTFEDKALDGTMPHTIGTMIV